MGGWVDGWMDGWMFVTNENVHSHNTRNKNGYLIPNVRTNCRKCTVSYAGPII